MSDLTRRAVATDYGFMALGSERFNPRHLRLDGTNVVEDLRERLYGQAAG